MKPLPKWVEDKPPTPLELKLKLGKGEYRHSVVCSGNRRKPVGHPGCCCLNTLKRGIIK